MRRRAGRRVILPSYTFVSTANAFLLRGATHEVRGHPSGHAQRGRAPGRAGDHTAHESDRSCALREHRLRDGCHRRTRAQALAVRGRRCRRPGSGRDLSRRVISPHRHARRLQLPRLEEFPVAAKAARCSSTMPASWSEAEIVPGKANRSASSRPGGQVHVGRCRLLVCAGRRSRRAAAVTAATHGRESGRRRVYRSLPATCSRWPSAGSCSADDPGTLQFELSMFQVIVADLATRSA